MKGITLLLVSVVILAGIVAFTAPGSLHADDSAAPIFVTKIPPGYRDWKLISVSHEAGNLNSIGAVLGNDVAIKAYREGKLPFPDGTIIARLAWTYIPSEENNKVFGRAQSFVPGSAADWYLQLMVKDSNCRANKYLSAVRGSLTTRPACRLCGRGQRRAGDCG